MLVLLARLDTSDQDLSFFDRDVDTESLALVVKVQSIYIPLLTDIVLIE